MTIRAPLVIGPDGLIEQLQSGDSISAATNAPSIRAVTNGESSSAITIGQPVYASAADTVKRAQANTKTTSSLAGVVYDPTIAAGAAGNIAQSGIIVATTAQWDAAVTSETGGLTFGSLYFVDPVNVGKLTTVVPTTVGQTVTLIGRALSTTELELMISPPIQL
jgi:hypothetical protein